MKKIININKLIAPEEYGIKVTDEVTVYPVNNFIHLALAFEKFEAIQDDFKASDIPVILSLIFDEEDAAKLAGIKGLDAEMTFTIIRAALTYSMNKEDITEEEKAGNEDTEGDELPN